MPKIVGRPNLHEAGCYWLRVSTGFRLGRPRLSEDSGILPRQLLSGTLIFSESYKSGRVKHEIVAELSNDERVDGGADLWYLVMRCMAPPPSLTRTADVSLRPTALLKSIGKMGLEQDVNVDAHFDFGPQGFDHLPLPVEISPEDFGAGFSHVIGYTLAKIGDLDKSLYEVTPRRRIDQSITFDVAFAYRHTLDENILTAALDQAKELALLLRKEEPGESDDNTSANL